MRAALDFSQTNWSGARRNDIVFDDQSTRDGTALPYPNLDPQKDTQAVRIGGEYHFDADPFAVPLRAGFFVEKAMIGTFPEFDDDPRTSRGFTLGTGFTYDRYHVDLAWVHAESDESIASTMVEDDIRTTVIVDDFTTDSDRFIVSLIVRF